MPEPQCSDEERKALFDEFALIQGKIDKVGDFLFKVKAWSISLTTAVLIGGASEKIPWYVVLLGLLAIGGFWLLEVHQTVWKKAFQDRCRAIDEELRRIAIRSSPHNAVTWAKAAGKGPPQSLVHAIDLASRENRCCRWLILHASGAFYLLQVFLVLATACIMSLNSKGEPKVPVSIRLENAIDPIAHESQEDKAVLYRLDEADASLATKAGPIRLPQTQTADPQLDESPSPESDGSERLGAEPTLDASHKASETPTNGT